MLLRPIPRSFPFLHPTRLSLTPSIASALLRRSYDAQQISRFHSSSQSQSNQSLLSRLSHRVLYKKDGITPRSKKRGFVIASWLSVTGLLLYTAISLLSDIEDIVLLLTAFIQLQQIDASFYTPSDPDTKQRNWDDWGESTSYFKSICKPVLVTLTWAEPVHVDRFFAELEDVVDRLDDFDVNHRQMQSETETLKNKIHNIMNSASHAVHHSLLSLRHELSNPESSLSGLLKPNSGGSLRTTGAEITIEGASEVVQHIREAIEAILHALQEKVDREVSGEIDKELSGWFKVKGDGSGSGKGSKGKGYDIIG
ncbi:uncharacterized protein C8R40DRAFT_773671 [Lentinula edodes]|uniref:uncharacterized protein n=1 Tax=Lentinula edodes TaxID=5353 RepID=UPI001E8E5AF5|nr:uncharacterized protein C8R40DRAFT_773671 [Lentinula edodes]KAH7878598.1 hypothetical protein C8R40DRAFT_773671 [Lentinula edodes]